MSQIFIFRYVDGVKTRFRLDQDAQGVVVRETQVPASDTDALLTERGYKFHYDATGTLILDVVPPREAKIMSFFSPAAPCWFPGCAQLRQAYNMELEKMGGENCLDCSKGDLIRKYQAKIREAWPDEGAHDAQ